MNFICIVWWCCLLCVMVMVRLHFRVWGSWKYSYVPGVNTFFRINSVEICLRDDYGVVLYVKTIGKNFMDECVILQECMNIINELNYDDVRKSIDSDLFFGRCGYFGVK